jgi:hypothetical protein
VRLSVDLDVFDSEVGGWLSAFVRGWVNGCVGVIDVSVRVSVFLVSTGVVLLHRSLVPSAVISAPCAEPNAPVAPTGLFMTELLYDPA